MAYRFHSGTLLAQWAQMYCMSHSSLDSKMAHVQIIVNRPPYHPWCSESTREKFTHTEASSTPSTGKCKYNIKCVARQARYCTNRQADIVSNMSAFADVFNALWYYLKNSCSYRFWNCRKFVGEYIPSVKTQDRHYKLRCLAWWRTRRQCVGGQTTIAKSLWCLITPITVVWQRTGNKADILSNRHVKPLSWCNEDWIWCYWRNAQNPVKAIDKRWFAINNLKATLLRCL